METGATSQKVVRFGLFEADLQRRILTKGGLRTRLQDQPFEVLALLLDRPGELVTREELQQKLWPADTFVAFDDGLNTAIKKLRSALGDAADNPRFIETVPRRGYRFIAPATFAASLTPVPETSSAEKESAPGKVLIAARERSQVVIEPAGSVGTRVWLFLVAAALVTVGAFYLFQERHPLTTTKESTAAASPPPVVKIRPSVAVMGFRNLSPSTGQVWLSAAFSEMLNTELAAGERLRMIPGEQISRAKIDLSLVETEALGKETLARVRTELGADYVVLGSYTALGQSDQQRVRLDLRLQDCRAGETITEESVTGKENDLFDLVSEAGTRLRQRFDVAAINHEEAVRVKASMPANVEAARLYAEGLTKLRSFEALEARDLLIKAAAADPKCAMIHEALASAWSQLGYDSKAKAEGKLAFDLATSLSQEDGLLVEGRYHETAHQWLEAIGAYRTLWHLFPDNAEYGLQLASVQSSAGQGKESMATVEALRKLPHPGNLDPRIDLAEALASESQGDFRHGRRSAATAAQTAEQQHAQLLAARAHYQEGWSLERMGEFDQAENALRKSESAFAAAGDRSSAVDARILLGELDQDRGNLVRARRSYEEIITTCRQIGNLQCQAFALNNLGNLFRDQNDLPRAKTCFEQVLSINRESGNLNGVAVSLGNLANLLDDMGRLAEAEKVQQQALDLFTQMGDKRGIGTTLTNLAAVMAEQGRLDQALPLVDRAVAVHRETGYRRGLSFALVSRADILEQQDRIAEAKQAQTEAYQIRKDLGTPEFLAMSLTQSSSLSLDQDLPSDAQSAAEQAVKQVQNLKAFDLEATAYSLLTRSLLAQGNLAGAKRAADHAMTAAGKITSHPPRMDATLAVAAVEVASGNSNDAQKKLIAVIAESSRCGYESYRLEAQLALYELDLQSGRDGEASHLLSELEREAAGRGYKLVQRKGTQALDRHRNSASHNRTSCFVMPV